MDDSFEQLRLKELSYYRKSIFFNADKKENIPFLEEKLQYDDDLVGSQSPESRRLLKEADSGNNEVQRLIRKMCVRIEEPATLWRSKATPDKNLTECEDCQNKAVQCVCEDEQCLDKRHECKAFKRHSECCGKELAEKIGQVFFSNKEKVRQLTQSYDANRENARVS